MYNPLTILTLQKAVQTGDFELFRKYSALVDDETLPHTLRGLLGFRFDAEKQIPLDEVEPVSEIVKRFKTGAMSYGSISEEAHKCLAAAMNQLGGKSNSGAGGEPPARLGRPARPRSGRRHHRRGRSKGRCADRAHFGLRRRHGRCAQKLHL